MIRKVWPLIAPASALGIDAYVIAGVLPDIAASLTTTVATIGLGVTAFTAAYALSGPLLSSRVAQHGAAPALLVALGIFNLGNLITAAAPSASVFLVSRIVAGAGAGMLTAIATATAAAMVADHERGRAMSLVTLGLSAGTVAGVPLGMLIGQTIGWRWTMGLIVLIGALSMTALAARSGTLPPIPSAAEGRTISVLQDPRTLIGITAAFLLGVASLGLYTYLLPMAESAGLGSWGFALIWAWGIGGVTGAAFVGKPLDRFGAGPLLVVLPILLSWSFAMVWLLNTPAAWIGAAIVWGAAGWASVPVLQLALIADRPTAAMPVIAFQMSAVYLGSAVGAALGSALLSTTASAADLAGWALIPTVLALFLTIWMGVSKRRPRRVATLPT